MLRSLRVVVASKPPVSLLSLSSRACLFPNCNRRISRSSSSSGTLMRQLSTPTTTTTTRSNGPWNHDDYRLFSTKPFPSNLKVDPRSSFAPVLNDDDTNNKSYTNKKKSKKNKKESQPTAAASIPIDDPEDPKDKQKEVAVEATPGTQQQKQEDEEYHTDDDDDGYNEDDDDDDDNWVFEPPTAIPAIPLPDRLRVPIYHFGEPPTTKDDDDSNNDNDYDQQQQLAAPAEQVVGSIWLNETVFGKDPVRIDLLKRAVDYHRAKKRGRRKAHTKRIGDIRGSTRKVRPQKGQGTARAGHRFPGHWRGGAKAHGPTNLTHYGRTKLNKKVRRLAVQHVLSQKCKEGNLILVNQFHSLPSHKTKQLVQWLQPFGIAGRHGTSALLIDNYFPPTSDSNNEEEDIDGSEEVDNPVATSYRGVPINLVVASGNLYKLTVGNQLRNLNVYSVLKHEKLVLTLDALTALEARLKED